MKTIKKITGAAIALSLAASTSLYATNGDKMIGVGAKTRAMGGAGIAFSHGAESTLVNPALITHVPDTEISFGGTIFMPDVKTQIKVPGFNADSGMQKSDADISMIPAVAIASQVRDNLYIGAGMWGTAGMGTDFRGKGNPPLGLFDMETTLQLMQFAVPVAYKMNGLSIGIAPIVQYGSLDLHYKYNGNSIGDGQHQDFGFGASIGATYDFGNGITLGAMYKSKIKMDYGDALSEAATPFGISVGSHLDQPAEFGFGLGWRSGPHGIAIDWKRIQWSNADGYKQFNWKDQDVFSVGYQYDAGTWALRVGYNHGSNPIDLADGSTQAGAALNMFNLLGFPATVEDHITAGGSYVFNKNFSADFTVAYALEKKTNSDISGMFGPGAEIKNKHHQLGLTVQLNYKF
ncbi:OmpP1/FadL family transporter [Nitratifractor sp.]